jgi:DNA repair ATPase RecN
VITHAALIAEKLQGAHERRTRGQDMSKDGNGAEKVDVLVAEIDERLSQLVDMVSARNPDASHVELVVERERVVELERNFDEAMECVAELERQLNESRRTAEEWQRSWSEAHERVTELEAQLADLADVDASEHQYDHSACYVAREVPWTDVAAGMMTLSREDHPRPWMVVDREGDSVLIRNGAQQFVKYPAPGETVRVLVPYVTDEQAEGLVASALGGTEVGS